MTASAFHRLGSLFPSNRRIAQLQHDLVNSRVEFATLGQVHHRALEELRCSNQELQAIQTEMQTANEELDSSREERRSVNEELHTVNRRLIEKVDELAATNTDLLNLFASSQVAAIFLDRHLIVRSFSPAIATLYSLIPSDRGRPLSDIVSRLHYDGLREDVAQVLRTREPIERRIIRADSPAHYVVRILPYREPDHTVSGALVTFVDVTSIVKAQAALDDADVRKDVFLATLSHELRNPLAPIRTAARLLESPTLTADQLARARSIISRQVVHMSSLLDDLLDVTRITRGAFVLKKEQVDLDTLMDAAVETAQPAIDASHHALTIERLDAPIMLTGDSVRLTQVISNLLANAAKYTPPGGQITVGSRMEAGALVLFVRDNGIGLAPEMLTRVFDMFTRCESDADRSEGGLGIGLALVKGLVELHGGRVQARSAGLRRGSEFVVSLPHSVLVNSCARAATAHIVDSRPRVARRILIADDNRDGAETLGLFFEMQGHDVHLAHTGAQALQVARQVRPEVGVLDIGMPGLNGYEVAEQIRLETWGDEITLIALTGWGQDKDKRRAHAAGFDHHVTKPIDPERLSDLLATAAHLGGPNGAGFRDLPSLP
jgi:two-component system CheB/CheR fusion protein